MKSVGERLRRERIGRGIDLATFSSLTRINQRYLEEIEAGNTDNLPSGFFYRSFVRQYAAALELDMAEIEADLDRVRQAEAPALEGALKTAQFPIKAQDPIVSESNRRYLGTGRTWAYVVLLVAMLVGCSAFYAWWRRLETVAATKEQTSTQTEPPAPAPNVPATRAVEIQPPPPHPPAASNPTPSLPLQPTATTPAPAASSVPQTKTPVVTAGDRVVVQVAATELAWVSVSADGKSVFSGLMQPNQSMTLGGKERTQLKTGNAGGLAISWNGKTIGPVGPKGQVRTVLMTPESYRIIAPVGSL
jgi:cytoskeleton protein RodZ